jgi:hypothetical protein
VVSTFALVIGLIVGNLVRPGDGFGSAAADATKVAGFAAWKRRSRSTSSSTSSPIPWSAPRAGEIPSAVLLHPVRLRHHEPGGGHTLVRSSMTPRMACSADSIVMGRLSSARSARWLHHRQVRHRRDPQFDRADPDLLLHRGAVRVRRARIIGAWRFSIFVLGYIKTNC